MTNCQRCGGELVSGRVVSQADTMACMTVEGTFHGHEPQQYIQLNDASRMQNDCDGLIEGDTQIWYMRPNHFRQGITGTAPDPKNLRATHTLLGVIQEQDPEKIFYLMQGEVWSPNGEASRLIRRLGLGHASMCVGDVIRQGKGIIMVVKVGFKTV